jgi:hypothetical protein
MFPDRQLQTRPVKDRSAFFDRLIDLGRRLASPLPPPTHEDSRDWYTGLWVDAPTFSDQLSNLQNSLNPAGRTAEKASAAGGKT